MMASPAGAQRLANPDSVTLAGYQRVLVGMRDTVEFLSARANDFRRDLRAAGEPTVLTRADRLVQACRATRDAFAAVRPTIGGWPLPERAHPYRDSLLAAMRGLTEHIATDCLRGLDPTGPGRRADTLRAWGPYRTSELGQATTLYHGAAARLARSLGIDLTRR
jgi:hypothetical protein